MTPWMLGGALAALIAAADFPGDYKPDARDGGPGTIDVTAYPEQQKKNYDMYAMKCAKCHPLARSVNARFAATEWKRYMKRMIRRPNSGINEEQAGHIYDFLKYYASQLGL